MKKKIKCSDCGKEVEIETNTRYRRKYCDKCSKERKEAWENRHLIKFEDCED
jgi:Zn finger protein HypA/HybF involved in hydrogenase expression